MLRMLCMLGTGVLTPPRVLGTACDVRQALMLTTHIMLYVPCVLRTPR